MKKRWIMKRFFFSDLIYPLWGPLHLWINAYFKLKGWPFHKKKNKKI